MNKPLLQVIDIQKTLSNGFALHNISFNQSTLQHIAIIGESGSGKSTLLKIIAGLLQPNSGKIILNNNIVLGPDEKLMPGNKQIAYLSQHYELLNNYVVKDLILFGNKLSDSETNYLLETCQVNNLLLRKTNELSGGERQRLNLCMQLFKKPILLVLDEPFSNLDLINKTILKELLQKITSDLNITTILASHEPTDILNWADEIIVLQNGEIIQTGTPNHIYHKPHNEYVAGLLGNYNLVNHHQLKFLIQKDVKQGKYIIRPQHINISSVGNAKFSGKIVDITFLGVYNLLKIQVYDFILTTITTNNELAINDFAGFNVVQENIHYLQ